MHASDEQSGQDLEEPNDKRLLSKEKMVSEIENLDLVLNISIFESISKIFYLQISRFVNGT